jgi:biopolymer transport protein ExbB
LIRIALVAVAIVAALLPRPSLAWWDEAWAFRKPITVETTASGASLAESQQNATVLVRLHAGNFGYFADTKPDGSDIRFIAGDDKTPLSFHIESFDSALGMAFIWVKLPQLAASSSETFYMYYGNPDAPAASDAGASWDVDQALVYHFNGEPVQDSTRYGNNPAENSAQANPASVIASGLRLTGSESVVVAGSPSLRLNPAKGLTLSVWVNADQAQPDAVVAELGEGASSLRLGLDALVPYLRLSAGGTATETPRAAALTAGTWHLLTGVVEESRLVLYVDGAEVGAVDATPVEIGGNLTIGASTAGTNFLTAQLDEFVVSNRARPAEWIKAQFANQGQNDSLLRYGEDTQKDAGKEPSYFLITLQNVTFDGWVVIGLLAVMFVASWIIMITKVLTIRRVRKDNKAFIADFHAMSASDLDKLDAPDDFQGGEHEVLQALSGAHDHYQSSPMYHLYHVGIQQVHQRVVGASAGAARTETLSVQSLDSIRAAIDATNVRETQKLNSQMVLLTLAIAGGPFLGLLGTVVGVMITFAVIAATGDVNVNSIAPGIAAALAATVAGLAVAIPALFGYNWLASQIKEIVADNRVFIDEFVTKLAERYS